MKLLSAGPERRDEVRLQPHGVDWFVHEPSLGLALQAAPWLVLRGGKQCAALDSGGRYDVGSRVAVCSFPAWKRSLIEAGIRVRRWDAPSAGVPSSCRQVGWVVDGLETAPRGLLRGR